MSKHCLVQIFKVYEEDGYVVEDLNEVPVPADHVSCQLAERQKYTSLDEFNFLFEQHQIINRMIVILTYYSLLHFNRHHDKEELHKACGILKKLKLLCFNEYSHLGHKFSMDDLIIEPYTMAIYVCLLFDGHVELERFVKNKK